MAITDLNGRPEAETLIGLHRQGFELCVLAPSGAIHEPLLAAHQVTLVPWKPPRLWDLSGLGALRRLFARFAPDLVLLRGDVARIPCLLTVARPPAQVLVFVDLFEGDKAPGLLQRLAARQRRVAGFVCDLKAPFHEHIQAGGLTLIPPGHDPDWYTGGPKLTRFGVPERVFTVGALATEPGDDQLRMVVEAARWLPVDMPIHFLLVAPSQDHSALRRRVRKNPFPQRFHLAEDIDAAPGLMAQCNVFVGLRWDSEPARQSLMNCLHNGVPPMVEDTTLVRQIINPGVSGLVIPSGDPGALAHGLSEFYEHPEQRQRLKAGAKREARARYSMDRVLQQTNSLLQATLAKR